VLLPPPGGIEICRVCLLVGWLGSLISADWPEVGQITLSRSHCWALAGGRAVVHCGALGQSGSCQPVIFHL